MISEKSTKLSTTKRAKWEEAKLTLSVHEVRDGHGVNPIGLGGLRVEDDIGAGAGASAAHVLLSESLKLSLNSVASLEWVELMT